MGKSKNHSKSASSNGPKAQSEISADELPLDSNISKTTGRPKQKRSVVFPIMLINMTASIFTQKYLYENWKWASSQLFPDIQSSVLSQFEKIEIFKTTLLYFAIVQFAIAFLIMNLRILSMKIQPASEKDSLSISLLNRILSNNLEQVFVFFCLFGCLVFSGSEQFSGHMSEETYSALVRVIPVVFLFGRASFIIGYTLATIVNISTFRSYGFLFSIGVTFVLIEAIFGQSSIVVNGILKA